MKTQIMIATFILALALPSCAYLRENVDRPFGFIPAGDAECRWGIMQQDMSRPFKAREGVFERADPLAYKVTCQNDRGEPVAPGRCFEIECVTPHEESGINPAR